MDGVRKVLSRPRVIVWIVVVVVLTTASALGLTLWPLIIAAILPWYAVVAARRGVATSLASVSVGAAWLLLVAMMLLPVMRIPLGVGLIVLWAVVGIAGAIGLAGESTHLTRFAPSIPSVLFSLVGPLIWLGTLLVSQILPGASHYSWVMTGDSANNVLSAREIVYHGGIAVGAQQNPVPLPAALLAVSMLGGRDSVAPADLLRHDVGSFVVVWGLLIALTCFLTGIVASLLVHRGRAWLVALIAAGGSVLPLTWFLSGYPIDFGFFNVHVALPLVFICCVAAVGARRSAVSALVTLLLACTLLLAVWSPLVLVPVAFGLYVVVTRRKELVAVRGRRLVAVVIALGQLLLYGVVVVAPGILAQGGALTGGGAVYPFSKWLYALMFAVGGVVFVVAFLLRERLAAWMLFVMYAATGIGLAALLFLSRGGPTLWTYYPTKLAWFASAIGLVMVVATLAALASRPRVPSAAAVGALAVLAIGVIALTSIAPTSIVGYSSLSPLERVASASATPDANRADARIFQLSDPKHPSVLWNSGDPQESTINFWLLQMRANSTTANLPLRVLAYGYDTKKIQDLCSIVEHMGGHITVISKQRGVQAKLERACPAIARHTTVTAP